MFGNCDFHEVPDHILERKLESQLKLLNNKKRIQEYVDFFKKRIRDHDKHQAYYYLKPVYIFLAMDKFKKTGIEVIFRIGQNQTNKLSFIDKNRTYKSWDDYIENNTLPEAHIIYPKRGDYNPTYELVLEKTIACSPLTLIRKYMKMGVYVATAVSSAALAATPLIPVIAPVSTALVSVTAGGSAYLGVESAVQITDLVTHDEDMSPTNLRAFGAYLDVASCVGGLVKGGTAIALAKLAKDEALVVARVLKYAGMAGVGLQRVSLLLSVLSPLLEDFSQQDFKDFCLSFFNFFVDTVVPFAKSLITFFLLGRASDRRGGLIKIKTLSRAADVAQFLFTSILPEMLESSPAKLQELVTYFSQLLCNKIRHLTPKYVDTKALEKMGDDFLSLMNKMSLFFNVVDITTLKISGVSFLSCFTVSALKIVYSALKSHLDCHDEMNDHPLNQPNLVKVWLKFMNQIKCFSPRTLIEGTYFLLEQISNNHRTCYYQLTSIENNLHKYVDQFLDNRSDQSNINSEEPLFSLENMCAYLYYDTWDSSKSVKAFYREKASMILRQNVNKKNSKFQKKEGISSRYEPDINEFHTILHLSPCLRWRVALFNRTILSNHRMMLFVTTIR